MDDTVEVPHVDPEFERAGGHDYAVTLFGERLFGAAPFVLAEAVVGYEGCDALCERCAARDSAWERLSVKTRRFSPRLRSAMTCAEFSSEPT